MANATAVVSKRGREQFQGLFTDFWAVKATINADSLTTGTNDTDTITVPGVGLGDIVLGVSLGVDVAGMQVTAYVSAANTVTENKPETNNANNFFITFLSRDYMNQKQIN